ncbi:MAG: LptF/LptG family permease [Candidatus Eisenbacteria bacterium]|nr:LptF/LptG family permease [Candidatus Eisenbacteria bacterium]
MNRPGILDRYVLREFLLYFALTFLFFVGIFAVVDVFEKIDRFLDAHAGAAQLAVYFALHVPSVAVLVMPMALLLAAMLTLSQMGKFNELTAMNVAGRSYLRLARPLLGVALLASAVSFVLEEYAVPRSNRARQQYLERTVMHIVPSPPSQRDNLLYMGTEGRVFSMRSYLVQEQRMLEPTIQSFGGGRVRVRIDAREGTWDGAHWVLRDGVQRVFGEDRETAVRFGTLTLARLRERPADFAAEERNPSQMTITELRRYIGRLVESGRAAERYEVDFQLKLSYPLINLVALLIAVAIAAQLRRNSPALAFGLSAVASFAFYGVVATGRALGQSGVLPPWFAGWAGHALFLAVAGAMLWKSPR